MPKDYKTFLLETNGGVPINKIHHVSQKVIQYLFGMHNGDYYASLYRHVEVFKTRLPFSTFPIGSDPFGNIFILTVHPENYGQIYFWEHEDEIQVQDGRYTDNASFVSYSFGEFLQELT